MNKRWNKIILILSIAILVTLLELVISFFIPRFGWKISGEVINENGEVSEITYTYESKKESEEGLIYTFSYNSLDYLIIREYKNDLEEGYAIDLADGSRVFISTKGIITEEQNYVGLEDFMNESTLYYTDIVIDTMNGDKLNNKLRWFLIYGFMNFWAISMVLITEEEIKRRNKIFFSPRKIEPATFIIYRVTGSFILGAIVTMVLALW